MKTEQQQRGTSEYLPQTLAFYPTVSSLASVSLRQKCWRFDPSVKGLSLGRDMVL